jgi:iron complex outermembrane receptor protein
MPDVGRRVAWSGLAGTLVLVAGTALASTPEQIEDLTKLSIDELVNVQVTVVSKRPEPRSEASGAIYVVTGDEIARAGATSLADALRGAPGVQVSRIDANKWAVAVRGWASRLGRSVLVLVDGRSVWTPLFAGVYWEVQDTALADVDRIEVHRGPSGALFGANALNGVVNVVTKGARQTPGLLLTLGGGTEERAFGTARYGGRLARDVYYRAYAKYFDRDGLHPSAGTGFDDWRMGQGGFRMDWEPGGPNHFTLQGDLYDGAAGQRVTFASYTAPFLVTAEGDADLLGRNLLARWRRPLGTGSSLQVQGYYDHTDRREPHFRERRDTFDVEAQHSFRWKETHETVWGASYRASIGDFAGVPTIVFDPARRTDDIAGLFAQDDWTLAGGRGRVTLGARLDWDDYTGWHPQPRVRAGWAIAPRHWAWAALARAVRPGSRLERDVLLTNATSATTPVFARAVGNHTFRAESVLAYEAGYRVRLGSRVFLDVAGYHNVYDDLATLEAGRPTTETTPPGPPRTILPFTFANGQDGSASGGGLTAVTRVTSGWRVQGTYSYVRINQTPEPGTTDRGEGFEGNTPRHQVWLSSFLTAGPADFDLLLRWVDRIPTHRVPAYAELDARVAYRLRREVRLELVGQNLLHARHAEFGGGVEVPRGVYASATLTF